MFARLGARRLDADRLVHRTYALPSVRSAIRRRFGDEAFDSRRRLNRRRLAAEVFRDRSARRDLNRIVHPIVHRSILAAVDEARRRGGVTLVLDVPLLLEKRLDRLCDVLVFVKTSKARREQRAARSRGWNGSEVGRREMSQKSLNFKLKRADYIVSNGRSLKRTYEQVEEIWELVASAAPRGRRHHAGVRTRSSNHRAHGVSRAASST
jgi:dephospho-CoA kinase